ncbi:MAG: GyrI-like domain-containing protein [Anaerolineae bacterium]|nr:GyrI-like domain-containing protein [Anaerolineae bacterium]
MSEKIDLLKDKKDLYRPTARASLVTVPAMMFLMIDGQGAPGSPVYQEIVSSLYQMAYTLKFAVKKQLEIDYGVMPLEGLWWAVDWNVFTDGQRDQWQWTMMIAQPEWVTAERVEEARRQVIKKGSQQAEQIRFEVFDEGLCAQVMHTGPYSAEGPVIAALHTFIKEQGCQLSGKHHEIYLGDPNRTAPERLKTVLRQPVNK